jgi:hypothetical protein
VPAHSEGPQHPRSSPRRVPPRRRG